MFPLSLGGEFDFEVEGVILPGFHFALEPGQIGPAQCGGKSAGPFGVIPLARIGEGNAVPTRGDGFGPIRELILALGGNVRRVQLAGSKAGTRQRE